MRNNCLLAIFIFVLFAAPCLAQGNGRACDLTGTWLGGSDPLVPGYQLTVVPGAAGRYSITFQMVFDPGLHATSYTGELRRDGAKTFTGYSMATFAITDQSIAIYNADPFNLGLTEDAKNYPEVDGVHQRVVLLDCDTLQSTIDWFGWYVPFTFAKTPFVTKPEIEFISLIGEPIVETYHRVSGDPCPACASGGIVQAQRGGKK